MTKKGFACYTLGANREYTLPGFWSVATHLRSTGLSCAEAFVSQFVTRIKLKVYADKVLPTNEKYVFRVCKYFRSPPARPGADIRSVTCCVADHLCLCALSWSFAARFFSCSCFFWLNFMHFRCVPKFSPMLSSRFCVLSILFLFVHGGHVTGRGEEHPYDGVFPGPDRAVGAGVVLHVRGNGRG